MGSQHREHDSEREKAPGGSSQEMHGGDANDGKRLQIPGWTLGAGPWLSGRRIGL